MRWRLRHLSVRWHLLRLLRRKGCVSDVVVTFGVWRLLRHLRHHRHYEVKVPA